MKLTIVEFEELEDSVWQSEALTAAWDKERNEFVIRAGVHSEDFVDPIESLMEQSKLAVEIEDTKEGGRLVWRGFVSGTELLSFELGKVQCGLIMSPNDWLGIVPQFCSS